VEAGVPVRAGAIPALVQILGQAVVVHQEVARDPAHGPKVEAKAAVPAKVEVGVGVIANPAAVPPLKVEVVVVEVKVRVVQVPHPKVGAEVAANLGQAQVPHLEVGVVRVPVAVPAQAVAQEAVTASGLSLQSARSLSVPWMVPIRRAVVRRCFASAAMA